MLKYRLRQHGDKQPCDGYRMLYHVKSFSFREEHGETAMTPVHAIRYRPPADKHGPRAYKHNFGKYEGTKVSHAPK